jgi:hypothetical protein
MPRKGSPLPPPNVWRRAAWLAIVAPMLVAARHVVSPPQLGTIIINGSVRDSMNSIWSRNNAHWNELAGENTLTQMIGSGKPTQREYMGCMQGSISHDTLFVTGSVPSHNMRQLQFAVDGDCDNITDFVGAWHTHPYRAAPDGHALKEAGLSKQDLQTFAASADPAVLVVWDVDSLDAAARGPDGSVLHPITVVMH